jgi:hypothetical protein
MATEADEHEAIRRLLTGLSSGQDVFELSAAVADLHHKNNTFPGGGSMCAWPPRSSRTWSPLALALALDCWSPAQRAWDGPAVFRLKGR